MDESQGELLQLFISEALEHLADIESDVLALEEAGANADPELLNKIFRAAHSIKGSAGFLELSNIGKLAHCLENVLGALRTGELVLSGDMVSTLLAGFDSLKDMVSDTESSGDYDISDHIVQLEALRVHSDAASAPASGSSPASGLLERASGHLNLSPANLNLAKKWNGYLYILEYEKSLASDNPDNLRKIFDEISKAGKIIESNPALDEISQHDSVFVLFNSVVDVDLIETLCGLPSDKILAVDEEHIKSLEAIKPNPGQVCERGEIVETGAPTKSNSDKKASSPAAAKKKKPSAPLPDAGVRVKLELLDTLMELAGELVLSRNQLLQAMDHKNHSPMENISKRIDLVTSELQSAIMQTRMQPVSVVFNKFPRVVRDLSKKLKKQVNLEIVGNDVELDKALIEGLSDPLTHLIRNSLDHGLETPDVRINEGKDAEGNVLLKASYMAGHVIIEVGDDGKGMDPEALARSAVAKGIISHDQANSMSPGEKLNLIFKPGFSTAEKVTDVSGRGVGMDVVMTNLNKLGGEIELDSRPGKGATVKIKLPLTLAIVPAQIIKAGDETFAIPQTNIEELLLINARDVKSRIELVGESPVINLRGRLLPLVRLTDVLGLEQQYIDPLSGEKKLDRRESIADRRSRKSPLLGNPKPESNQLDISDSPGSPGSSDSSNPHIQPARFDCPRSLDERRYHASSTVKIVVVSAGAFKYGLVVCDLMDVEEIVVKPLGRHMKKCSMYAGATIMGDGGISLILDVSGLAQSAALVSMEGSDRAIEMKHDADVKDQSDDACGFIIFKAGCGEQMAVPLELVDKLVKIKSGDISRVGDELLISHGGAMLPLFTPEQIVSRENGRLSEDLIVLVMMIHGRMIGLLAPPPIDALERPIIFDKAAVAKIGVKGTAMVDDRLTLLLDVASAVKTLCPGLFKEDDLLQAAGTEGSILLVDDSSFFRRQIGETLKDLGYSVLEAGDGFKAWEILEKRGKEVDLVLTDVQMPNMDGLELTRKIKSDDRFLNLPVMAITTLYDDEALKMGYEAGVDDYREKTDISGMLKNIRGLRGQAHGIAAPLIKAQLTDGQGI